MLLGAVAFALSSAGKQCGTMVRHGGAGKVVLLGLGGGLRGLGCMFSSRRHCFNPITTVLVFLCTMVVGAEAESCRQCTISYAVPAQGDTTASSALEKRDLMVIAVSGSPESWTDVKAAGTSNVRSTMDYPCHGSCAYSDKPYSYRYIGEPGNATAGANLIGDKIAPRVVFEASGFPAGTYELRLYTDSSTIVWRKLISIGNAE
jgi:hypothetical protein